LPAVRVVPVIAPGWIVTEPAGTSVSAVTLPWVSVVTFGLKIATTMGLPAEQGAEQGPR
jgi:hypothetical protein